MGENAVHLDKLLNTGAILFAVKVALFGVLKSHLASKSA
jgi:hypothetical protein